MIKTLALALSVTSIASVANAADLAVKARPAPLAVMVSGVDWTGAYVGGSITGVWGETDTFFSGSGVPIKTNPEGAVFGVLAGYDWQLPSNVVIGARLAIPCACTVVDTVADPALPAAVSHKTPLIGA